jgi:hypothetical protein
MADVRDHFLGAEEGILEEKRVARVVIELVPKVLELYMMVPKALVLPKVLELYMMVLKALVVEKFPSVATVVTDDLKLAVIMEVLKVVVREAPEVVVKGARVVEMIVVEVGAMILAVKVVAAKKAEVLDMDPRVL